MKLDSAAAAVAAALFAVAVNADKSQGKAATVPKLPTFTPTKIKAPFLEQFTDDWEKRWKPSHAKKDMSGSGEEDQKWAYVGKWAVEEPYQYKGIEGDKGLVVKNAAAHHAISAKFPEKIDNKGKTLVVQYEVKFQKGLECGGGYLKLLRDNEALHQEEFGNKTPYVIMFGPDKCGHTNKVHFIFNHMNPKTGQYEEKHLSSPPVVKIGKTTELYTLIIHPNNTYAIRQNGVESRTGSLLEDFSPAVNPPAEIDDPDDKKPEDWVDKARIPDPEAVKPDDWDEDAPFEIVDEEAVMPDDWLVDEPVTIPDPEGKKPEDWDDEEDGDWIASPIPNPNCADASGCGPWTKPNKRNPAYKGKWMAPYIDNPDYKGTWSPRKIANPDFYEDKTPSDMEPIGAIGFEIWTMQNDILFDNIYIGHSVADAEKFAARTFQIKHPVEVAQAEADKPKPDEPRSPSYLKFLDDPVLYVREKLDLFFAIAQKNPIEAVKFVPEVAGGVLIGVLMLVGGVVGLLGSGSSASASKAASEIKRRAGEIKSKTAADAKQMGEEVKVKTAEVKDGVVELADKSVEAAATGADKAKAEVTKRTTRSQT